MHYIYYGNPNYEVIIIISWFLVKNGCALYFGMDGVYNRLQHLGLPLPMHKKLKFYEFYSSFFLTGLSRVLYGENHLK